MKTGTVSTTGESPMSKSTIFGVVCFIVAVVALFAATKAITKGNWGAALSHTLVAIVGVALAWSA